MRIVMLSFGREEKAYTSYPVMSQIFLQGCIEGGDSILTSVQKQQDTKAKKQDDMLKLNPRKGQIKNPNNHAYSSSSSFVP